MSGEWNLGLENILNLGYWTENYNYIYDRFMSRITVLRFKFEEERKVFPYLPSDQQNHMDNCV